MMDPEEMQKLTDSECETCTIMGFHTQLDKWIPIAEVKAPADEIRKKLKEFCSQKASGDYPWIYMEKTAVKESDFSMFRVAPVKNVPISLSINDMELEKGSFQRVYAHGGSGKV